MPPKPVDAVDVVLDRLMSALSVPSLKLLAEWLGIQPTTLHNRRARNSMPTEQINVLCEARGLNPDWVYWGKGDVYAGDKEVRQRAALLREVSDALLPLRLPDDVREGLCRLLAHAIGGNSEETVREWQAVRSAMSASEQELIDAYRRADESMRATFDSLVRTAGVQQRLGLSGAPKRKPAPMVVDRDPETARMKPKEKAAFLAAKKTPRG